MANSADQLVWFQSKISNLFVNGETKNNLIEINAALANCNKINLEHFARNVPLEPLFDALNTSDKEEVEAAANACSVFLHHLRTIDALKKYGSHILRALKHPSDEVKRTFLLYLTDSLNGEVIEALARSDFDFVGNITEFIGYDTLFVAQAAVSYLKKLGQSQPGLQLVFSERNRRLFNQILALSDEVRFRVYECIVDISLHSPDALSFSHDSGILSMLITDIKSSDCLIQLNVLELLSKLVESEHGFAYLQEQQVITYLCSKVLNVFDEPMSFLLLPGLITFLGNLVKLNPKFISQNYPGILTILFSSLENADPTLVPVLISTVSHIASTNDGKRLLESHEDKMKFYLKKIYSLIDVETPERFVCLTALPALFHVDHNDPNREPLYTTTVNWYNLLGPNFLNKLMEIVKLPFIEQRLVVFEILSEIVHQPWGLQKIIIYPALVEYLLDRTTEYENNCKHSKYDLVKAIIESNEAATILGTPSFIKLKEFVKEGAYYVVADPEMAFEGAT